MLETDALAGSVTQADFDLLLALEGSSSSHTTVRVPTDKFLSWVDGLTSDQTTCPSLVPEEHAFSVEEPMEDVLDMTSSSVVLQCNSAVPQQLLPFIVKYQFESCRSIYFESMSEQTSKLLPSLSKSTKGLACDFFPDYKCKQSPFPVITTCRKVPSCSLCARCGSLGDHTMVHCLGCCEVYHYFCAHLPERLIPRLRTWFCHRCATCSICSGKEISGRKFLSDIIDTCFRCQKQYHVCCNKTHNFHLINPDTPNQLTICNQCLFRSQCRRCRSTITVDDVYRDCLESTPACVECRNTAENDLCRSCAGRLRAEKVKCESCLDFYHCDCLCDIDRSRKETGLAFLCHGCISQPHVPRPGRWTVETGRRTLDTIRREVIKHMNTSYCRSGEKSPASTALSRRASQAIIRSKLVAIADISETVPTVDEWYGQIVPSEIASGRNSISPFAVLNGVQGHFGLQGTARRLNFDDSDVIMDYQSTMDKVLRSPIGENLVVSSPASDSVRELLSPALNRPPMSSSSLSSGASPFPVGSILHHNSAIFSDRMVTIPQSSGDSRSSDRDRTGPHSLLLKFIDEFRQADEICASPQKLETAVHSLMSMADFSSSLPKKIENCFRLSCSQSITQNQGLMRNVTVGRQSVFPVIRRGSEPPPSMTPFSHPVAVKIRVLDARQCLFCSVAGDYENDDCGGRLLSVGFDVFAHIGCLWFASSKRRVFDYMLYKLSNLESTLFRRSECALCPMPFAIIACAHNQCRRSYHYNCAVSDKCSFSNCLLTGMPKTVCHLHGLDDLEEDHRAMPLRMIDIERSFIEMPVFARSPPTNVQNIGNPTWSTGVRKEDVRLHLGGAYIEELGRLARGWETKEILLPCGFKMQRVFWSSVTPHHVTRYQFLTFDMNMYPALKALSCIILELQDLPDLDHLKEKKAIRLRAASSMPTKTLMEELWLFEDADMAEESTGPLRDVPEPATIDDKMSPAESLEYASVGQPAEKTESLPHAAEVNMAEEVPNVMPAVTRLVEPVVTALPEQQSDDNGRPNRSRSCSPEIPVSAPCSKVRQMQLKNGPVKRCRTPSRSPKTETKRSPVFPGHKFTDTGSLLGRTKRLNSVGDSDECTSSTTTGSPKEYDPIDSGVSELFTLSPHRRRTRSSLNRSMSPELPMVESVMLERADSPSSRKSSVTPDSSLYGSVSRSGLRRMPFREMEDSLEMPVAKKSKASSGTVMLVEPTKKAALKKSQQPPTKKADIWSSLASTLTWSASDVGKHLLESQKKPAAVNCKKSRTVESPAVRNAPTDEPPKRKKGRPPKLPPLSLNSPDGPLIELNGGAAPSRVSPELSPVDPVLPVNGFLFFPTQSPRKSARLVELQSPHGSSPAPVEIYPQTNGLKPSIKDPDKSAGQPRSLSKKREVKFAVRPEEKEFEPIFNDLASYIVDPSIDPLDGPYFPPREDVDPEPSDYFTVAKQTGRMEVARLKRQRMDGLMHMIKTNDLRRLSKEPSQMCLLVGSDGFFAASHWPDEVVSHLYDEIERTRRLHGLNGKSLTSQQIRLNSNEFVGLSYPVTRYLLEQLPAPVNGSSSYGRKYFSKEALKARAKIDLKPSEPLFVSRREPTCTTCSLPIHCFTFTNGRTYSKVPVVERQVVLKWKASCEVFNDGKDVPRNWIRVFNSRYVDPSLFPDWYEDVRHVGRQEKQTFVLCYAQHPHENSVFLALVAKRNFSVGIEVKFNPRKEVRPALKILGVDNFSCAQHGRNM